MKKKGFTLAELLVVVAIIAVLVAIAIPVFSAQTKKAEEAVEVANARTVYAEGMTLVSNDNFDDYKEDGYEKTIGDKTYTFEYDFDDETWSISIEAEDSNTTVYNEEITDFNDVDIDGE